MTATQTARLAAALRGEPMPQAKPLAPPAAPRAHVLPRAVEAWERNRPVREALRELEAADTLLEATMPRAWIDGTPWSATTPPEAAERPTARDQASADTDTAPAPFDAATGPPANLLDEQP